jgi:hypothetical protein
MTVKEMLSRMDSRELSEWYAYDQRWPLPDGWQQTARLCRVMMAASGNYKRGDLPDDIDFMPVAVKPEQSQNQIVAELMKLKA